VAQKMTQQEVEQWIAANGGGSAVQYAVEQKSIKNPAYDPYDDTKGPQYVTVPVETWKNSKTGAVLSAKRGDDGAYELWESASADPNKPGGQEAAPPGGKPYIDDGPESGQSGRRWGWNPATRAYDRDLGSSPSAQKPTSASARKPVAGKPGVYEVTTKDDATNATETHYEDEQGNRVPTPTEEGSAEAPISGRPGWVQITTKTGNATKVQFRGPDGKVVDTLPAQTDSARTPVKGRPGVYEVTTKTDGKAETHYEDEAGNRVATPPEKEEISKGGGPNGEDVRIIRNADGTVDRYEPIAGQKAPVVDMPALRMEAGQISQEVIDRWNDLNSRVARGEITKPQAIKEFEPIHAAAQTRLTEIQAITTTQQGIYRDQLTQRAQDLDETQSRRGAATAATNAATGWLNTVAGKPGAGKGDFSGAVDEIINRAYKTQGQYGATRETPAVQLGPAAQQANSLNLPGMPSPSTPMTAPGAATSELGQPGDPALASAPAAAPAARPAPLLPPRPPVNLAPGTASAPPAVQGTPSPLGDTGAPPVGAAQGDSMGAASKILTPMASSGGGAGAPMMGKTMDGGADDTPPALASLLEMELPGGIKVRVPAGGGSQQPASGGAGSAEAPTNGGDDDQSDRIKRMRDLAPDDPSWQRSLDEQERRYGRPTPQSMFAA
jgi:hypothetical protein